MMLYLLLYFGCEVAGVTELETDMYTGNRWWPTASTIWFGLWDDMIENLDADAAETLRVATKDFIRQALGLAEEEEDDENMTTNPMIRSFQPIAAEACAFYNQGTSLYVSFKS
jgi:hypothetical protein